MVRKGGVDKVKGKSMESMAKHLTDVSGEVKGEQLKCETDSVKRKVLQV